MSDLRALEREYKRMGWIIVQGRKHKAWYPPGGGQPVYSATTPSDRNAVNQIRRALKRRINGSI